MVFGPEKGKSGNIGKTDEELIRDLISIHNAENWLGGEGDDFAPGFFSAVAPPDVADAVTPVSSSESAGLASGVSSRSPTPDPSVDVKEEMSTSTISAVEMNHVEGNSSMKQETEEKQSTMEASDAGPAIKEIDVTDSVKVIPATDNKPEESVSVASQNAIAKQDEGTTESK